MPLILEFKKQKQVDLCEFKATVVFQASQNHIVKPYLKTQKP